MIASNKLIQQLKDELTSQSAQVRDGQRIRQQLQASEDSVAKMEDRIVELTASLSQANAEIKSLSAKLAASRAAETSSKAPGSTTKFRTGGCRAPLTTSDQTLAAQTKEDLYGDLTGLIIRGMARSEDETIYDCIQTGRNGSKCLRREILVNVLRLTNKRNSASFQTWSWRRRRAPQLRPCPVHLSAATR